jgi:hypothetical protein
MRKNEEKQNKKIIKHVKVEQGTDGAAYMHMKTKLLFTYCACVMVYARSTNLTVTICTPSKSNTSPVVFFCLEF